MKPSIALPALASLLAVPAAAQMAVDVRGGGEVKLAGDTFAFRPSALQGSKPKKGTGPMGFLLQGTLTGKDRKPFRFELTFDQKGTVYGLQFFRPAGPGVAEDRWAATLKTQVKVLELEPKLGGKLRLALSGPLSGILDGAGRQGSWSGELWATFSAFPE